MIETSLPGESNPDCLRTGEACLPLPLSRRELGAQGSNLEALRSRRSGSAGSPIAHRRRALGGIRTRSIRQLGAASLPRLEYEHVEPPPGADPGLPLYGSGAAAVRGGIVAGAGVEPAGARVRALLGSPTPHPAPGITGSRGGGIRTRIGRYLKPLRLPVARLPHVVRRQGLEPCLLRLRVECF